MLWYPVGIYCKTKMRLLHKYLLRKMAAFGKCCYRGLCSVQIVFLDKFLWAGYDILILDIVRFGLWVFFEIFLMIFENMIKLFWNLKIYKFEISTNKYYNQI